MKLSKYKNTFIFSDPNILAKHPYFSVISPICLLDETIPGRTNKLRGYEIKKQDSNLESIYTLSIDYKLS